MKTIEERARLAAWQIWGDVGLSEHSVERVSEIIADKILEQKTIDNSELIKLKVSWEKKAYKWIKENVEGGVHPQSAYGFADRFKQAMEEEL